MYQIDVWRRVPTTDPNSNETADFEDVAAETASSYEEATRKADEWRSRGCFASINHIRTGEQQ